MTYLVEGNQKIPVFSSLTSLNKVAKYNPPCIIDLFNDSILWTPEGLICSNISHLVSTSRLYRPKSEIIGNTTTFCSFKKYKVTSKKNLNLKEYIENEFVKGNNIFDLPIKLYEDDKEVPNKILPLNFIQSMDGCLPTLNKPKFELWFEYHGSKYRHEYDMKKMTHIALKDGKKINGKN